MIMRKAIEELGSPDHPSLAYGAWAPTRQDGKVPDGERQKWLKTIVGKAVSPDYQYAFLRWKAGFTAPGDEVFELKLKSRLLIGHGNPSASDIGLSLHHTWGVPIIPGSAVKGLLAHYVDAVYGPTDPALPPWEQQSNELVRFDFKGLTWNENRNIVKYGPGRYFREVFGSPDAADDDELRKHGEAAGASSGCVVFHDALYVPDGIDMPLALDVITVHHKEYYRSAGELWPNDYDSPNPISFLSVKPKVKLLFALSGRNDWTALARKLLEEALRIWGVGGKTSSGYGRISK